MKKYLIRLCALAMAVLIVAGNVDAQTTTPKKKRTVSKKTAATKTNTNKNAGADASVAPPKDTVKPAEVLNADIKLDTPRRSLRNDAIIERNLVKDRTPLT